MAELGAKMGPRWRQDGPRWGLAGHLEATWGVILSILGGLGGDLCKKGRSIKMSTTMAFWLQNGDLGGLGECTWRLLGATLGDLGHKLASLGRSWRQVGNFLATCWEQDGRRWPKMANLSRKSFWMAVATVAAGAPGARLLTPLGLFKKGFERIWKRIGHSI